ncbi:MAG: hypothetical protein RI947_80 [Candidatus Parcubacteria bacterium]|jgi:large subunit ribosomal protein L25
MAKSKKSDHPQITLAAEARTVLGKKVKQLRKQGMLPGNVYGPDFKSLSVTIDLKEFITAYRVVHETGIVYIKVGNDSYPTLVKGIQKHPVSDDLLHVDFRKIDLKHKIETPVPVVAQGESAAINQLGGVLITQNDHLTVEALPTDIPSEIAIDISTLTEVGQEITVADLPKSATYVIIDAPETVVFSVTAHKEESVTPETTTVAPEVITEKATEEGAEGEASDEKSGE